MHRHISLALAAMFLGGCLMPMDSLDQEDDAAPIGRHVEPLAVGTSKDGKTEYTWSKTERRRIAYCVERGNVDPDEINEECKIGSWEGFGAETSRLEAAAREAARAWEDVADVDFVEVSPSSACGYCDSRATGLHPCPNAKQFDVVFSIVPLVDMTPSSREKDGQRVACKKWSLPTGLLRSRARTNFLPGGYRATGNNRRVEVGTDLYKNATNTHLAQTLTHEFGHVLGFVHEHSRADVPEGLRDPICPVQVMNEPDLGMRYVTAYDRLSVMHYPAKDDFALCGGRVDGQYFELSFMDKMAAPCVYGQPRTGTIPNYCDVMTILPSVSGGVVAATTTLVLPQFAINLPPIRFF